MLIWNHCLMRYPPIIVNNIKDGMVYFNTSSLDASNLNKVDPEKADKTVTNMAKKQVKKELNK